MERVGKGGSTGLLQEHQPYRGSPAETEGFSDSAALGEGDSQQQ